MVDRHGPQRIGRAEVEIDDVAVAGWTEIDLPSWTTELGEYREDQDPDHERKVWGETSVGTLTMVRTIQPNDTQIWDWNQNVVQGNFDQARKEVTIELLDDQANPLTIWRFEDAWIQHYEPPDVDLAEDDIATERIVLAFDEMTREEPSG